LAFHLDASALFAFFECLTAAVDLLYECCLLPSASAGVGVSASGLSWLFILAATAATLGKEHPFVRLNYKV
jgi:hypothetical protein